MNHAPTADERDRAASLRNCIRMSRRPLISGAVVAIFLILVGLAQTSQGHLFTNALGLSAPAEPYTELYFSDPSALGGAPVGAGARTTASFVIHNAGHAAMTYAWTITVRRSRPVATGTVRLGPGQRATVTRRVSSGCGRERSVVGQTNSRRAPVSVSLRSPAQSIRYWDTCHA